MPPKPRSTPPKHSISAARAAARLEDYERDLSKKVLPPSDPVEAFYKPVDPQAHSYKPRPPVGSIRLSSSGPTKLRVPRMFERYEQGHPRQEVDGAQSAADMSASGGAPEPPLSPNSREYQNLRRWNLPKGEWLQTAESGHAPGPGYRDMAPTQSPRSCGPSTRFSSGDLGGSSPSARLSPVPARMEAQRGGVRVEWPQLPSRMHWHGACAYFSRHGGLRVHAHAPGRRGAPWRPGVREWHLAMGPRPCALPPLWPPLSTWLSAERRAHANWVCRSMH